MLDEVDLSGIADSEARRILDLLRNVIEVQAGEIATLRAENQRARTPRGATAAAARAYRQTLPAPH